MILGELLGGDSKTKVDAEEEVNLKPVQLWYQYTPYFGIVRVVVVKVIKELGC